jgi:hypothetical protein
MPIQSAKEYARTQVTAKQYACLTKLWGKGKVYVGDLTSQSADYVARYITKKFKGPEELMREYYRKVNVETGEIIDGVSEYADMSRRPGVGVPFFNKYERDFYTGKIVMRTKKGAFLQRKIPRTFERMLEKTKPELVADLKEARVNALEQRKIDHPEEFTEERMKVHDELFLLTRKVIQRKDMPMHNDALAADRQFIKEYKQRQDEIIRKVAKFHRLQDLSR